MDLVPGLSRLPAAAIYPVVFGLIVASIFLVVRLITTQQYNRSVRLFLDDSGKGWANGSLEPPQIPYTIPWLGHTMDFMDRHIGRLWKDLFARHPRSAGAYTLLVGGKKMYVIFNATAVQAMFRDKKLSRHQTDLKLYENGFGMSREQGDRANETRHFEHEINTKYILRTSCVNELTAGFIQFLDRELNKPLSAPASPNDNPLATSDSEVICNLAAWLRPRMFTASTTALFGSTLLDDYPEYVQDFFALDAQLVGLFFGLPQFLVREATALRSRVFNRLTRWNKRVYAGGNKTSGTIGSADSTATDHVIDPDAGPNWEPGFGSRYNRARQIAYRERGLDDWSIASFDFGTAFGLNSNAIPATTWMLMHILDPRADGTLYPRVMEELRSAVRSSSDGSQHIGGGANPSSTGVGSFLDIPTLISLPLLQSIWTETLRLYADVFVFRNLEEDVVLPLDESGKRMALFKKGNDLVAPMWISREDPSVWSSQRLQGKSVDAKSPGEFDAERFIVSSSAVNSSGGNVNGGLEAGEKEEKKTFSLPASTSGKYFPFGGGRTICPGRVFAKQESLAALAMMLLTFDFEILGFVDEKGNPTDCFPGLANLFPGNAVVTAAGDLKVKIRRRPQ